jgi:hypothetical protein
MVTERYCIERIGGRFNQRGDLCATVTSQSTSPLIAASR